MDRNEQIYIETANLSTSRSSPQQLVFLPVISATEKEFHVIRFRI